MLKEKRLRFGGFEVGLAAEAEQAARIQRAGAYRFLIKPLVAWAKGRRASEHGTGQFGLPAADNSTGVRGDGSPEAAAIWDAVSRVRWYHTIDLGHGVVTPGFVDLRPIAAQHGIPADLTGKRCLEIGTWDGFWSFEMERRGASELVALDLDSPVDLDIPRLKKEALSRDQEMLRAVGVETIGAGFNVAKKALNSKVERRVVNIYELSPETVGRFDVVFIGEVLEHLRDPQTALENIFSVTSGIAIIAEPFYTHLESFDAPLSEFVGTTRMGIWWQHSAKSLRMMIELAGFDPIEEIARLRCHNRLGSFSKIVLRAHRPRHQSEASAEARTLEAV